MDCASVAFGVSLVSELLIGVGDVTGVLVSLTGLGSEVVSAALAGNEGSGVGAGALSEGAS